MIYRYRRVSTPVERQQTKWVVFGVALTMSAFLIWLVPQIILFGSLSQPGSLYDLIGHPLFVVASLAIPLCLGIAILRYRLWDIDVIVNRTLVYGSLTVILGALYAGLIVGLGLLPARSRSSRLHWSSLPWSLPRSSSLCAAASNMSSTAASIGRV
jgi:hypothetical protein